MSAIRHIPGTSGETGILNTIPVLESKSGAPSASSSFDQPDINFLSRLAQQTGLDITNSSRIIQDSSVAFSFNYQDTFIQHIQANGFWSSEKQSLSFDLSFEINECELAGNQNRNRTIRFDMHISVDKFSMNQLETGSVKESIQDFVYRIAKLIAQYAADKDHEIAGLILNFKDARNIYYIDEGKTLQLIHAAISLIYMTNQILDRNKEDVVLYVPRKEEPYVLLKRREESNLQFSVQTQVIETTDQQKTQDNDPVTALSEMESPPEEKADVLYSRISPITL